MTYRHYLERTRDRQLSPLVQRIIPLLPPQAQILDLGCGAGVEVYELAMRGFRVTAVDKELASVEFVRHRCQNLNVNAVHSRIESFAITEHGFDAIIALHSLPFLKSEDFVRAIHSIERGVRQRGFIVLRLFGPKDDWAKASKVTPVENGKCIFSRSGQFIFFQESEKNAVTAEGNEFKHWHNVDILFQVS